MRTDYKNLNLFEASALVFICLGFLIIGLITLSGLTDSQQKHLAQAVEMFDLHEQAQSQVEAIKFVFEVQGDFYEQFYLAFTEVTSLPDRDVAVLESVGERASVAVSGFLRFADRTAVAYAQANSPQALVSHGQVAGAMVVNEIFSPPPEVTSAAAYQPPRIELQDIVQTLKQKLIFNP